MKLTVLNDTQDHTWKKLVKDIFAESECPYETLRNSFPGCEYDPEKKVLQLVPNGKYTFTTEVETR